jgi:RES domain-containing protein
MKLFRIVQDKNRTKDLSGIGSFRWGGRWNSKGTYMLYTSENSSLAFLENLVHFDKMDLPPQLYIVELEVPDRSPIYTLPDKDYNAGWMKLSLLENQQQGDRWMNDKKYLGVKVRSAINNLEYNVLLNPLFPNYNGLVRIVSVEEIPMDERLILK